MIKLNGIDVGGFIFPGGEVFVTANGLPITDGINTIEAHVRSSDDILKLIMLVDGIRGIIKRPKLHLFIPYFPYARQDKRHTHGEAFGAHVMAEIINDLNFTKVIVLDIHSKAILDSIYNVAEIEQYKLINRSLFNGMGFQEFCYRTRISLVAPDQGALSKFETIAKSIDIRPIYCSKIRNPSNGKISGTVINGDVNDKNLFIIDDICDGGSTFINIAKIAKANGARDLYLYVTHGIFSKGLDVLREHFKHIFCIHTFLSEQEIDANFLTVRGVDDLCY